MSDILLSVHKIKKIFGATVALNDVDFELRRGEIHGLIGENGSGKSTLTSVIAGIYRPDDGTLELEGKPYKPRNVVDAQRQGVAIVVQEMGTIPNITVAENIYLGKEKLFKRVGLVSKKKMEKSAAEALADIGESRIAPSMPTLALSFEDRKIVELAKAMVDQPSVFILDETTTAISTRGRDMMYAAMKKLRQDGSGIIFITHDLEELISVCDRVTVLRDGVLIGSLTKEEFSIDQIKTMMVGRELKNDLYRTDYGGEIADDVILTAENLTGAGIVENVSFKLRKGEILGFGGLSDSGMHELGRLLFGAEKLLAGAVTLNSGEKITKPSVAVKNGIGYLSKNRDQETLMLRASVRDNIALASLEQLAKIFIPTKKEKTLSEKMIGDLGVKCASQNQQVRFLSGGNKQKVVFGKWIGNKSKILILDCPTRGVDIGVKCAMYDLIFKLKTDGFSIMIISEELQELIGMCDRVMILKNGRLEGEYQRSSDLSEHVLLNSMI